MEQLKEGEFFAGQALLAGDRQLRITRRCIEEDLGSDRKASLEDLAGHPIIKAFIRERRIKVIGTRRVEPLAGGQEVWVLAQGHRHRGGTWHDEEHGVVWLVAYGWHESGSNSDFFPYCKHLDQRGDLMPTAEDYAVLLQEEALHLARQLMVEPPLLLKRARESGREERMTIGGKFGTAIAVEVADDLEAVSVAFDTRTVQVYEHVPAILAAFVPDTDWEDADRMPSRALEEHEIAFTHLGARA
jgi:hypothetical protein